MIDGNACQSQKSPDPVERECAQCDRTLRSRHAAARRISESVAVLKYVVLRLWPSYSDRVIARHQMWRRLIGLKR